MTELLKLASKLRRGNLSRVERHMVADAVVLYANEFAAGPAPGSPASPSPGREPGERPGSPPTAEELVELREALGLLTTIKPDMEIDVNDPVGMAKQIEAHVREERARVRREALAEAAELADAFEFTEDIAWWRRATKKEISGHGLRLLAEELRKLAEEGSDG